MSSLATDVAKEPGEGPGPHLGWVRGDPGHLIVIAACEDAEGSVIFPEVIGKVAQSEQAFLLSDLVVHGLEREGSVCF